METIIGQTAPAQGGGDLIKDTTTESFVEDVIEASREVPVLVDFWAPWCGPCKQLTPIIEKVVTEAGGAVRLVKMNIDDHPEVAQQLRVQSIPAVFAFKDGQPVDGFMGAQPESQIRQFIGRLAGEMGPSPAEEMLEAADAAFAAGEVQQAAQLYSQILQEDQTNGGAIGGLSQCFIKIGDSEKARQILELAQGDAKNHAAVKAAEAALNLAEKSESLGDGADLEARIAADPTDWQAHYDLALIRNGNGDRAGAVEALLTIVAKDRAWNDEAARKQLLEFFDAYGPTDPATVQGRRKLSSILFS